jgi:peptidoglycan/xylan/chitin deacetylase (PgdA/CDA1 family)
MSTEYTPPPWVFMYHSVERYTCDPYRVTVHPDRFERQMRWLHRRGRRGVSMRELLAAHPGECLVGLTFDDGYADFVPNVMPVLRRYGFTATVFVLAGLFGGTNAWDRPGPRKPLMTADDVRMAATAGIEIGSHGLTHRRLPDVDDAALRDEVRTSRVVLGDLLGRDVDGFCYPYGGFGAREVDAVRAAGYRYGCAVDAPPVAGRYALARTFVGDRDRALRLFAKRARHGLSVRRSAR